MEENKEVNKESFEFFMKEIDRVIHEMEKGTPDQLDKLIQNFEYGSELIEKCQTILEEAEVRIQKITARYSKEKKSENA
ncbi:MAG: exodeoxyribonuclease VII small subunit [Candidatus Cloacimonetes bacterium]|nr:exodeoxyribonuclease VII small subunit [Candidatus Cloacimonadota bacterium]